jgi:hypothetical protein
MIISDHGLCAGYRVVEKQSGIIEKAKYGEEAEGGNTKLKTFPRGPCGLGTFCSVFILILAKTKDEQRLVI